MSGICGIVNLDGALVDAGVLRSMAAAAPHRSRDGVSFHVERNAGFAHLALHTTPESGREHQPLLSGDGLVWLTADARVDNRDELAPVLCARGFLANPTPTDAELILAAYECWGDACPEYLCGDFAFAIWDRRHMRLLCARDPLGVKPMHVSRVGATVCFATEAQQLLRHPAVSDRLDEMAMARYLVNDCSDEESTLYRDVRSVAPGYRVVATGGSVQTSPIWQIDPALRVEYRRDEEYAERFRELFRRAVADRLRAAGGTVGVFMSGGLDSCSVAAMAQRELSSTSRGPRLVACSYAFERLQECDERAYSSLMAQELGIDVQYVDAESHWLLGDPAAFAPTLETPFLGWESLNDRMLSELRSRGARVVLTGHAACYSRLADRSLVYADRLRRGQLGVLRDLARESRRTGVGLSRALCRHVVRPLLQQGAPHWLRQVLRRAPRATVPNWVGADFARRTGLADLLAAAHDSQNRGRAGRPWRPALGSVGRAVYWYDRAAARFGMEARHPLLDRRLVEFMVAIPPEQVYGFEGDRLVFRRAMEGILPEPVRLRRGKTRFFEFLHLGLRHRERLRIQEILEAPVLAKWGIVDAARLRGAYEDYCSGRLEGEAGALLWFPITLERWLREYHGAERNIIGAAITGPCPCRKDHVAQARAPMASQ